MYASESSKSTSLEGHLSSSVSSPCKNRIISWKSMASSWLLNLRSSATQQYKWKVSNPSVSLKYVSQMRTILSNGNSLVSKQLNHRNENCINSIFSFLK
ncbi:hypothetical protein AYI69_g2273 [Smittium culicis]|uniref:Uncharacterized protein n=1 Tax=Smittium culicis TaxID=133412 RepID=A0A1R1YMV8_9FUNG|nr:hypothetical protein AYI69_g2273 [Smittium culicis]